MPLYPTSLATIPDDGTWNHSQVGDEIEAVELELGVNPSGAQTDVAARFTTVENRVTAVEGATTTAGVEVASAQLTTDYDIKGQSPNSTTFTDIGLSIAVGAQTRAYNVSFSCTFVSTSNSSLVGPKLAGFTTRIVDSTVTTAVDVSQIPIVYVASGAFTLYAKGYFVGRVAAGQAATTWKVQVRTSAALDANITAAAIFAGTDALATGVSRRPAQLQAITV